MVLGLDIAKGLTPPHVRRWVKKELRKQIYYLNRQGMAHFSKSLALTRDFGDDFLCKVGRPEPLWVFAEASGACPLASLVLLPAATQWFR